MAKAEKELLYFIRQLKQMASNHYTNKEDLYKKILIFFPLTGNKNQDLPLPCYYFNVKSKPAGFNIIYISSLLFKISSLYYFIRLGYER